MLQKNKEMSKFITELTGVKVNAKYIENGSMAGTWRVNDKNWRKNPVKWWDNTELHAKLNQHFVDFDGDVIDNYSGNGGLFSIFIRTK